jgi:hypothetical protein
MHEQYLRQKVKLSCVPFKVYFYPKGFFAWFRTAISLTTGPFKKPPGKHLKDRAEHTATWLFDGGVVHALTIILQLRSDIACLIFFSGDAIWQRLYNPFMRYLLIITRNKLIVTHLIICERLSLFAALNLTLWLNIADPWHEHNRTSCGSDSRVHGIRFARDWWG